MVSRLAARMRALVCVGGVVQDQAGWRAGRKLAVHVQALEKVVIVVVHGLEVMFGFLDSKEGRVAAKATRIRC